MTEKKKPAKLKTNSPRYLAVRLVQVRTVPEGQSVTDFEGLTGSEVETRALKIWNALRDDVPSDDPNLWTCWLHWVQQALETGSYEGPEGEPLLLEALSCLQMFLAKDAGVFLRETAQPK